MKLYLQALALFIILVYLADIRISFYPLSISVDRGWHVLAVILIICGAGILYYQGRWDGLRRGAEIKKEVIEEVKEEIKNDIKSSL